MLKTFSVPAKKDSVREEFFLCQRAGIARVTISKGDRQGTAPIYWLLVDGKRVGALIGKELVCGADRFAFVPSFDNDQELRLESLKGLVWGLSLGRSTRRVCEDLMDEEELF